MVSNTPHSLATEHLPMFISGPGETDIFFNAIVVIVILAIMGVGALYFTLHALPEKMAKRTNSNQILLISVMCLVALFSHNNYFFIGALLLAAVRLPDWSTPLNSIAKSLEGQAEKDRGEAPVDSHQGVEPPKVALAPASSALAEHEKDRGEAPADSHQGVEPPVVALAPVSSALAEHEKDRGEAPADSHQGVEPPMVEPTPESSALAEQLKGN